MSTMVPPELEQITSNYGLGAATPGFSALIHRGLDVICEYNVGKRDDSGNPLTASSNFRLASITKQFTAVAVLQLIEAGKLRLDTAICDIFIDFPPYGRSITIQHLLTHTSGIEDYESLTDLVVTQQVSDEQVVEILKTRSGTTFDSGTAYRYSNSAYCLLAVVVAKLSGMSFEDYLQKHVFAKANMPQARLNTTPNIPERVYGYRLVEGNWMAADQSKTSSTQGDGGIYASVTDLAAWQKSLYGDSHVLKQESITRMSRPYVQTNYQEERYGFGIAITSVDGRQCYLHHGESIGFENALFYLPEDDISIALLSNMAGTDVNMITVGKSIIKSRFI